MNLREFLKNFDILSERKKYGIPFWQCPSFLFAIFGLIIIFLIIFSYLIFSRYIQEPEIVSLIVLAIATVLLILAFFVNRVFEILAETNKMKSEFVNIVSHQLRAPLSNLRWAIDLLMSGRLGKIEQEQVDYFKILKENSMRMIELVKDLLITSKIETGKISPQKEIFFIQEITEELIKKYEPFAKASNVEINFSFQENLPPVFADPNQIKLVIENLLDNAIRYTKGKGVVEIKVEKKNKKIYFEIKDKGVGIPKEEQKYIFKKFFRSSNVLKHQTIGTGLGLFISKMLIEKAGGKMGFESEENKGSVFWFSLPVGSNLNKRSKIRF